LLKERLEVKWGRERREEVGRSPRRRGGSSRVDFGWGKGQLEGRRGSRVCRVGGEQRWLFRQRRDEDTTSKLTFFFLRKNAFQP
jgi:hypothetical protein